MKVQVNQRTLTISEKDGKQGTPPPPADLDELLDAVQRIDRLAAEAKSRCFSSLHEGMLYEQAFDHHLGEIRGAAHRSIQIIHRIASSIPPA